MDKCPTKKLLLLLMLLIFCIAPFGCSNRNKNLILVKRNNKIEDKKSENELNATTEITAFNAINGQTFYGVVDSYRVAYPENDSAKCKDAEINNFFGVFLQEEEANNTQPNTDPVKFKAFSEKKNASPLYELDDASCKSAEVGYAFSIQDNDGNNDNADSIDSTTKLETLHFLQTQKWEGALTQTMTQSTENLTDKILFSSSDSYYFIYPIQTDDSGITLNILSDSTLDVTYTTTNVLEEDGETDYELRYKDIKTVAKHIELKIETTDGTFYTTINEEGTPGLFPDTVSVELFKDKEEQDPLNYKMELDYTEHKIRFKKINSID